MFLLTLTICSRFSFYLLFYVLIYFYIDSSKQRRRLRSKISAVKANLKETVDNYNHINSRLCVNIEDVQSGVFSWMVDIDSQEGINTFSIKKGLQYT